MFIILFVKALNEEVASTKNIYLYKNVISLFFSYIFQ